MPAEEKPDVFFGQVGRLRKNDWEFRTARHRAGCGSRSCFRTLAELADELTVINSMVAETSNHTPATFQENCGFRLNGFPVLGSWLSYGLGSETENLPAFVVIPDARGLPAGGHDQLDERVFAGTAPRGRVSRAGHGRSTISFPAQPIDAATERAARDLLGAMNRRHLHDHGDDDALSARIRSYELAAKMQLAVPEVTRHRQRNGRHAGALRARSGRIGRFRPRLLARAAAARAGRAIRAAFLGRIVRQSADQLGRPREYGCQPRAGSAAHRSARRGAAPRSATAGHARRHAGAVHHRVRPHAVHAVGRRRRGAGSRSQSIRLFGLDGRRRPARRHDLWRAPTSSATARSKIACRGTIFTPRCCTCWASIMSG